MFNLQSQTLIELFSSVPYWSQGFKGCSPGAVAKKGPQFNVSENVLNTKPNFVLIHWLENISWQSLCLKNIHENKDRAPFLYNQPVNHICIKTALIFLLREWILSFVVIFQWTAFGATVAGLNSICESHFSRHFDGSIYPRKSTAGMICAVTVLSGKKKLRAIWAIVKA